MGNIKDIVDLAKDLESRAKDRKDIETLRSIISLTQAIQAHDAEVLERDIRVMQENAQLVTENADLKHQLAESQAEDVRIHRTIEFRKGKRTGGRWLAFCPTCHMPAGHIEFSNVIECTARCGWKTAEIAESLEAIVSELR